MISPQSNHRIVTMATPSYPGGSSGGELKPNRRIQTRYRDFARGVPEKLGDELWRSHHVSAEKELRSRILTKAALNSKESRF